MCLSKRKGDSHGAGPSQAISQPNPFQTHDVTVPLTLQGQASHLEFVICPNTINHHQTLTPQPKPPPGVHTAEQGLIKCAISNEGANSPYDARYGG